MATIDDKQRRHLEGVSKQSLEVFQKVSGNARSRLGSRGGASFGALAFANTFTMEQTAKKLDSIERDQRAFCLLRSLSLNWVMNVEYYGSLKLRRKMAMRRFQQNC